MEDDSDWAFAHSLQCEEDPALTELGDTHVGQVTVTSGAPDVKPSLRYKPGLPDWAIAGFKLLAEHLVYEFLKQGPQSAAWVAGADGEGWQITVSYREAEQFAEDYGTPRPEFYIGPEPGH
jgi:hypothetical protein